MHKRQDKLKKDGISQSILEIIRPISPLPKNIGQKTDEIIMKEEERDYYSHTEGPLTSFDTFLYMQPTDQGKQKSSTTYNSDFSESETRLKQ